jgi:O-antigen/teichoic acid export membrane protein
VIDRGFLNEAFHFSTGNYLAGLFMTAPNMILPIMVLNVLGAEQVAYYYIAYAIASLLFMIPGAISMSLFVEGSYGEALKKTVVKSLIVIFSLLIPAAALLYVCGGWVLDVVGADYAAGGLGVLRMMVVASLFVGFRSVYFAVKRIQRDVKGLVVLSGVIGGLLIGLGYVFILMFGVVGVGYAWLVANVVGSMCAGVMVWRERWV